jgi:uncharacterized membrane protein YccC
MSDEHVSAGLPPKPPPPPDLNVTIKRDSLGVHFAVHIFVATWILWVVLKHLGEHNPIWAISSMIAVSDPQIQLAMQTFRGRISNAILGCIIGLLFIAAPGESEWKLPIALATTVLISSYVVHLPVMWRQAPITAAVVIAAGLEHHSKEKGIEAGMIRVGEVMLGCVVGLIVTVVLSKLWPPPKSGSAPSGTRK